MDADKLLGMEVVVAEGVPSLKENIVIIGQFPPLRQVVVELPSGLLVVETVDPPTGIVVMHPGDDRDADSAHDILLTVTILDTQTGETRRSPPHPDCWKEGWGTYWWTDGNGSCDCNRRIVFEGPGTLAPDGEDWPCRHERYRVVAVEPLLPGYELADFNRGYDDPHVVEAIKTSGSGRTTLGYGIGSKCGCCGQRTTADNPATGGLWVKREGTAASHICVCESCSAAYDPAWPKRES